METTLGDRISLILKTKKRSNKKVTQAWVSHRLGLGKNVLLSYISNRSHPRAQFLVDFCDLLDVNLDYVLRGVEPMDRASRLPKVSPQLSRDELWELSDLIADILREREVSS